MKIVVWGINYAPEVAGIGPFNTALCEFLSACGNDVEMVTAFAYYPEWKIRKADRGRLFRSDVVNNVLIHRCWMYVPKRTSILGRILHEASFVLISLLRVLAMEKPDVFVVISPPLLLGIAASVAGLIKRSPFVFHVQDLQPDAAVGLAMLRKGLLTRFLYWSESFAYSRAARVAGISLGIVNMFRKKGVPNRKLVLFPNGIRLPANLPEKGAFRRHHGFGEECFIAVYSGNLGLKQGLSVLVEAAQLLHDGKRADAEQRQIRFVIAGDGVHRDALSATIRSAGLDNILLLPLQPEHSYREMLADADCMLITQQQGTGEFFFPSKLLASLAAAKPVLTVADASSELAKAVEAGKFGFNVPPSRPDLLAARIRAMAFPLVSAESKMGSLIR